MFHFVRDYETVKVEQEVPNEFVLVLDEGSSEFDTKTAPRPKGAYYKNIERKMLLKKKRVNVRLPLSHSPSLPSRHLSSRLFPPSLTHTPHAQTYESYGDKWDVVKLTHAPMSHEEEQEREEALSEVVDPLYLLSRADADAEGEVDDPLGLLHAINGSAHAVAARDVNQDAIDVFGE